MALLLEAGLWLVLGAMAALWWMPRWLGSADPLTLKHGLIGLAGIWIFAFNDLPRLGPRRFFRENRFIKIKLLLLALISAGFGIGFLVA